MDGAIEEIVRLLAAGGWQGLCAAVALVIIYVFAKRVGVAVGNLPPAPPRDPSDPERDPALPPAQIVTGPPDQASGG